MGEVLRFTVALENTGACPVCGVEVVMPSNLLRTLRESKRSFYCVNGHSQSFKESEADKLKRKIEQLEREKKWAETSRDSWREQAAHHERSKNAMKGQLTKVKKRVGRGVCPCCNRSFENLRNHMAVKHPTYHGDE